MKDLFKNFIKNVKNYVDYIMKVNFRELFINVVILLCIVILSALVFAPVELVRDIIRSFIVIYIPFDGTISLLYNWVFYLLSSIIFVITFMFLFNKRFANMDMFKKQVAEDLDKTKNSDNKSKEKESKKDDDLDLPKTKN